MCLPGGRRVSETTNIVRVWGEVCERVGVSDVMRERVSTHSMMAWHSLSVEAEVTSEVTHWAT